MEYTFKTSHALKLLRIAKKLNISKKIKNLNSGMTGLDKDEKANQIGLEFAFIIVENLTDVENELCELLADIDKKTVQEIKDQDLFITLDMIKAIFTDKRVLSFFTQKAKA